MIKYLKEEDFYEATSKGTILVDFYADWCGPCQMMGKILETLDVDILKVNTDEFSELAIQNHINSIPTLMLYKDGNLVDRLVGLQSKDDVIKFINQ